LPEGRHAIIPFFQYAIIPIIDVLILGHFSLFFLASPLPYFLPDNIVMYTRSYCCEKV